MAQVAMTNYSRCVLNPPLPLPPSPPPAPGWGAGRGGDAEINPILEAEHRLIHRSVVQVPVWPRFDDLGFCVICASVYGVRAFR